MHGTIGAAPHILLTTDAVGGVWRYSLAVAAGICADGGQCTLVAMGPAPSARQREEAEALAGCRLIDTELPLEWTASGRAALQNAAEQVGQLARHVQARTLHLHTPALAAFDWPVPVVAVAHSCVGGWWQAVYGGAEMPDEFRWRAALMQDGLGRAAAVIAPSQAAADVLGSVYNMRRRIDIVHNGLAATRHAPVARAGRVLTAGRLWDGGKNIAMLDRAACMLQAPVDAAGLAHGPGGASFVPTSMTLLGHLAQNDLRACMARAAIFAAPSIYEPFGLAVLEAAQIGCALALSDIPSFRELWDGAAVFIDAHDPAAWAEALGALLAAPARAAELGARAVARSRRYTARAMVQATMAIHSSLALQAA